MAGLIYTIILASACCDYNTPFTSGPELHYLDKNKKNMNEWLGMHHLSKSELQNLKNEIGSILNAKSCYTP